MLEDKKLFLLDIDGTIAIDGILIDGTKNFMNYVLDIGGKYIFITNNSTKSIKDYVEQFIGLGIKVDETNFITASYATALYLQEHYKEKKIFVVGTKSFIEELKSFNINTTEDLEEDIQCAVVAYDNELTYKKIEKICELLSTKKNIDYIATNPDLVCPTKFGFVPDCGAICKMIKLAVNREPIFIGKPNKIIGDLCIKKSGFTKEETLVIGDRLYTDIACGINSNIDTALVLTGEAKKEDIETTILKPEYIFKNIKELYEKIINII